ncbi:MAG: 50S ribosomal protein L13 [archaeon]
MKVFDGKHAVLGRLASISAKALLNGKRVVIVNAEDVVIVGRKENIIAKYRGRRQLKAKGNPLKGRKYPKRADLMVKESVKGMLPTKKKTGREALIKLKVYLGVPKEFEGKLLTVKSVQMKPAQKHCCMKDISVALGSRWENE